MHRRFSSRQTLFVCCNCTQNLLLLRSPGKCVTFRRKAFTFGYSQLRFASGEMGNQSSSPRMSSRSSSRSNRVADVLKSPEWPVSWPYSDRDFERMDESNDFRFYDQPRIVYHIDDSAVRSLTRYYGELLKDGMEVLDLCSSWVSHYPESFKGKGKRVVGLGMNEEELRKNPMLTDYVVQDLNEKTAFPFEDESFDLITNTVSVDYLNKPLPIFKEMRRVLKPGGLAVMAISNRCFPSKAWKLWLNTGDMEHVYILGTFFHFAGFNPPEAKDLSPNFGITDPLYIVQASRPKTA